MNKSPEAFRTISEVADQLDVPAHVLRFWETRFVQVKPVKRGGGRRYYRPDDVRLLRGIRGLLYDDGLTIKGVQKVLREQGVRHVIALGSAAEPGEPQRLPAAAAAIAGGPPPAQSAPALAASAQAASAPTESVLTGAVHGSAASAAAAAGAGVDGLAVDQAELFGHLDDDEGGTPQRPIDRDALRQLVCELEALRAVMVGGRA